MFLPVPAGELSAALPYPPRFADLPGPDAVVLDFVESAVLLGCTAEGCPWLGGILNLQLNLLCKPGGGSQDRAEFWKQAQAWVRNYVSTSIEAAVWNDVLGPKAKAIGDVIRDNKDATPEDHYPLYTGPIREACEELREYLVTAAALPASHWPTQNEAFSHFLSIATLDLVAWRTLIRLDQQLAKGDQVIADHKKDLTAAIAFYTDDRIKTALTDGYWYWRRSLTSEIKSREDIGFYFTDSFFDPPAEIPVFGDGECRENLKGAYIDKVAENKVNSWLAARDRLVGAFRDGSASASGARFALGIRDGYSPVAGPVYAAALVGSAGNLRSLSRRQVPSAGNGGLFAMIKSSGADSVLSYGDTVSLQSVRFPKLSISGQSLTGRAQLAQKAGADPAALQWIVEGCWPQVFGKTDGLPIVLPGNFRLKNVKTGKYLAWEWPQKLTEYQKFHFALADETTGNPLQSSIFTAVRT